MKEPLPSNAAIPDSEKTPPSADNALTDTFQVHQKDRHFQTDHLLTNLRSRTISSGFITILAQGLRFVINLSSTIVLARLLTPQDFGIVAMVSSIIILLNSFTEAGLGTAALQRENITHAQVSGLFWVNAIFGSSLTLLFAFSAPWVASFYRTPALVPFVVVLSLTTTLSGATVQHLALLNRQMRFRERAVIDVVPMVVGMVAGLTMASMHFGPWSLVGSQICTAFMTLLLAWRFTGWRPNQLRWDGQLQTLIAFGANLTLGNVLNSLSRGVDVILVGRFFGADALGLYSRAGVLLMRPMEQIIRPIDAVMEPALSRVQNDGERYRRMYLRIYELLSLFSFAFTGLFIPILDLVINFLLGPKWDKSAPVIAAFGLAVICYPLMKSCDWIFTTQGRGRDLLVLRTTTAAITIASFLCGIPFGPVGIAASYSASCLLLQLPLTYYFAGRRGHMATRDLWMTLGSTFLLWIIIFLPTIWARQFFADCALRQRLFYCLAIGICAGVVGVLTLSAPRRIVRNLFGTLRELRGKA